MSNIGRINVHDYEVSYGLSGEHNTIKSILKVIIRDELRSINIENIDLYNLKGREHNVEAGRAGRRLVIYTNGTTLGCAPRVSYDNGAIINGKRTEYRTFLGTTGNEDTVIITSTEGIPLAEYSATKEELNILFDVMYANTSNTQEVFIYIMREFERLVWHPKTLENSWIFSSDKTALTKRFSERMRRQREQAIANDKESLETAEARINEFKLKIKQNFDKAIRLRRSIATESNNLNGVSTSLIRDLDLIVGTPNVIDLQIIDGIFHIWTDDIYCYDENGKRYYIGKCKFTINLENTDVRFFNLNNCRRSYWTEDDPHPHVSGENGQACLGSVASTIAELCANSEFYALVLICIDFLENANISDPAGANVINWDEVDTEGNIIVNASEVNAHTELCEHCELHFREGDMHGEAYISINGEGMLINPITICDECRDEHYYYSDHFEAVIGNNIDDRDYMDEEDEEIEEEEEQDDEL